MEKLKMVTKDKIGDNIAAIKVLFPNCISEVRDTETGETQFIVDFDVLKQELSDSVIESGIERYRMEWPGKREALLASNAPIAKTLRPFANDSVDFEATMNTLIEGDNLDSLKLLQQSLMGKVKLIYIDPPYNTGNDFIYADDFSENASSFLERSLQSDSDKNKLVVNPDSSGRFHSTWLSMIYSRLRLARSLLRNDGVIFVSIDDGEVHNLRKVADEVFGESNFVANVIWEKKYAPSNDARWFSDNHDHILVYAKNKEDWKPRALPRSDEQNQRYTNRDNDPRGPWKSSDLSVKSYAASYDYEVVTPSGRVVRPPHGACWRVSRHRLREMIADNRIWFGEDGSNVPSVKRFLSEVKDGVVPLTIWKHTDVGHNQAGRQELKKLFDGQAYFDGPKPVSLLRRIIYLSGAKDDDIIMDFFAGSGTTAHAVLEANAEDGASRKFVLVQLDEKVEPSSEAGRAHFSTIADITKERIRLAGKKLLSSDCHPDWNRDVGFRVFKVDTSNMKDVYYRPDDLKQADLLDMVDNVKEGRTAEDLLFQVLVDWGVDLTLPIHREMLYGKTVFFVDDNALVACFEKSVSEELVKELAKREPLRVVFRDSGFVSDAVKINVEQIFRQLSPTTDVKTI